MVCPDCNFCSSAEPEEQEEEINNHLKKGIVQVFA
jgi:hypothetical protein